jgi:hypothetical protein
MMNISPVCVLLNFCVHWMFLHVEQTTKKRLGELKCHLKKRGYNNASINHCFNKASGIDRKDLIQYKEKNSNNRSECHLSSHTILRSVSTNCTFQEVDNIFCFAVGIAVYDEFFSSMCAAEFRCALDAFASHT